MSQGSADLAGANQSNLVARHGNLSFEPEPGGGLGELNLVIPFDRPVQVAPCSIVRHPASFRAQVKRANPARPRSGANAPSRNDGVRHHVSTSPVLEPLAT